MLGIIFGLTLSVQASAQNSVCNNPPASPVSKSPIEIFLKNDGSEMASVFWVGYDRVPVLMSSLAPGEDVAIQSFVGHVFYMATNDGECYGVYYAN